MINTVKRFLPLILCCTLIGSTHANEEDMCFVYTATPAYTFDAQFRALILKPTANNLYYAAEAFPFDAALATPIASPKWAIFDFHPDYHFGFDIGLLGVFECCNSNLAINWEHFSSTTCAAQTVANENNMLGPFSSIGPDAAKYKQVNARVKFTFNEVNARYGQYVQVGSCLFTNLFAGIGVAQLKQCMATIFSDPEADISRTFLVPTSFVGAGPEVGFDVSFTIVEGLRLTGQFVAALLMGTMKNNTTYLSTTPELALIDNPSPNKQTTAVQCRTQLVPSFTERLGLAYQFCLCDDQYAFKIEAGFEAKVLLNAIQTTDLASGVVGVGPTDSQVGVFARTFERNLGNFALSGFYIAFDVGL